MTKLEFGPSFADGFTKTFLLQICKELRMSATDSAMDTGEKVYGGCEGPDAM